MWLKVSKGRRQMAQRAYISLYFYFNIYLYANISGNKKMVCLECNNIYLDQIKC